MSRFQGLLGETDFARVEFTLEFIDPFLLSVEAGLRLRRELRSAAMEVFGSSTASGYRRLFEPECLVDPVLARKIQKPSAPFALLPITLQNQLFQAGDQVHISAHFFGTGIQCIPDFCRVLDRLGTFGFFAGEGRFALIAAAATDLAGNLHSLGRLSKGAAGSGVPLNKLRWWLEDRDAHIDQMRLRVLTPARLLSGGRPLFRPGFKELFPFILRRVGSVLGAYCGVDLAELISDLQKMASSVGVLENHLAWRDWKTLQGEDHSQDLGGLFGELCLGGEFEDELVDMLRLGSLMNLGKSAAFGSGHYTLILN